MKLTVIGGCGSRSLMLAKSLAQQADALGITEVVFMDIDAERVHVFGSMVREIFARIALGVKLVCTTDQLQAVENADFIITTIRVGKEQSRMTDEKLALKHGVIGQETTGAGGFAMAMRSIPVLLEYCKLIQAYASPEVMVFNFTNPAGLVTQALRDKGYSFVYGICDAPSGFLRQLGALYHTDPKKFEVRLLGLNHLSYFTSIKCQGKELLPDMLQNPGLYQETDMRYFEPELARHMGCLLNEYLYYFYYREKALANIQKTGETRGERIQNINANMLEELKKYDAHKDFDKMLEIYSAYIYARESDYMAGETSVVRNAECVPRFSLDTEEEGGYAGVALALIRARITKEKGEMILCMPNQGTVDWLEAGDVIEVSCEISEQGATPKKGSYALPQSAKELIRCMKYYERTAARAITEQNREMAVDALMAHPLVNSYSLAKELLDEYLNIEQEQAGGWGNA